MALFLTLIGKDVYALLRDLCSPQKPDSFTIDDLAKTMKDHLQPTPNVIMERYKFKEIKEELGEGIKEYIAKLKKLASSALT